MTEHHSQSDWPGPWVLQVCPECGWHTLDENHVRGDDDEHVGGPCEAYLYGDGEYGSCGPCLVVEVVPRDERSAYA